MDDLFIITIAGRQILKGKKISTLNWKNKNKKNNSALNRGKFYYVACTGALRTLQRKCLSEKVACYGLLPSCMEDLCLSVKSAPQP